jgi:hypothetical protein
LDGKLELMPEGVLKKTISDLTDSELLDRGMVPPKRRPSGKIDVSHLEREHPNPEPLVYRLMAVSSVSTNYKATGNDSVVVEDIDPVSLYFQGDFESKNSDGKLELAFAACLRDVYHVGKGLCMVSLSYWWNKQYVHQLPKRILDALYYNAPLPGMVNQGAVLGDCIVLDSVKRNPMVCIAELREENRGAVAFMGGPYRDMVVQVGSGVSFEPPHTRSNGNPSLEVMHGIVVDCEGGRIHVQLLLSKRNMPSYLCHERCNTNHLLQTNLSCVIQPEWIQSTWAWLPYSLWHHGGEPEKTESHTDPAVFRQDALIIGHMDIELLGDYNLARLGPDWDGLDSLNVMFDSFGPLEGVPLGHPHNPQMIWKQNRIREWEKNNPGSSYSTASTFRATFSSVESLSADSVLPMITCLVQMFGGLSPGQDHLLQYVSHAVKQFAKLKGAETLKARKNDCTLPLGMPGHALMYLVDKMVPDRERTTRVTKGRIQVEIHDMRSAAGLIGTVDGKFDFTKCGQGHVELFGPVLAIYEPYDSKKPPGEERSANGFAYLVFEGYASKDRHNGGAIKFTDSECPGVNLNPSHSTQHADTGRKAAAAAAAFRSFSKKAGKSPSVGGGGGSAIISAPGGSCSLVSPALAVLGPSASGIYHSPLPSSPVTI